MIMRSYGLGEDENLGQVPWGAIASVASTASSGFNIFGGLFGKSSKQKKAESMKRRTGRAASILNSMQGAISKLPADAEEYLRSNITTLTTTGANSNMRWMLQLPRSIGEAFVSVNPGLMGKKRAVAALRSYQGTVSSLLGQMLPDNQWYPPGYNPNLAYSPVAPLPVGVPGPPPPSPLPTTPGYPVGIPPPTYGPPYAPSGYMVPTQDGQAKPIEAGLGLTGLGNIFPWLLVGGLLLPVFLAGPRRTKRGHRKYSSVRGRTRRR